MARKAREGVLKHNSSSVDAAVHIPIKEFSSEFLNDKNEKVSREVVSYTPVVFEERYVKVVVLGEYINRSGES